jgi:hypothetical protein
VVGSLGGKALQLKAPKERSPQKRESKANNTGGDGTKILNVLNLPVQAKTSARTSPPDGFKQRSAFKTIRSVSCDHFPLSPSIIKNNKTLTPTG